VTVRPAGEQTAAWVLYAGIADWASLPEPVQVQGARPPLGGKAAVPVALRAIQSEADQRVGAVRVALGVACGPVLTAGRAWANGTRRAGPGTKKFVLQPRKK
jgi:hypothetical protein